MENKKEKKYKLNKYQVASKLGNIVKKMVYPCVLLIVGGVVGANAINKNKENK
jgi:hypothetical protein